TCNADGDCPNSGDVCANHVCTAGSGASGGLGTACTSNADCVSGQCGSDGTNSFCVVGCDTSNDGCPNGFGCLSDGDGTNGVCWPGADNGNNDNTGGCQSKGGGGTGPAMILLGLGFAGLILVRKRA
ncbi:MAG TPA: MYXO-CTERM sorting domain-containing protein, partial [Kofleriaceae bacterium]|nr:MYXO-CTERM sorting domain-containing protein [Kofleriaceae bacterium]